MATTSSNYRVSTTDVDVRFLVPTLRDHHSHFPYLEYIMLSKPTLILQFKQTSKGKKKGKKEEHFIILLLLTSPQKIPDERILKRGYQRKKKQERREKEKPSEEQERRPDVLRGLVLTVARVFPIRAALDHAGEHHHQRRPEHVSLGEPLAGGAEQAPDVPLGQEVRLVYPPIALPAQVSVVGLAIQARPRPAELARHRGLAGRRLTRNLFFGEQPTGATLSSNASTHLELRKPFEGEEDFAENFTWIMLKMSKELEGLRMKMRGYIWWFLPRSSCGGMLKLMGRASSKEFLGGRK